MDVFGSFSLLFGPAYSFLHPFIYPFTHPHIHPSIHLSIHPGVLLVVLRGPYRKTGA